MTANTDTTPRIGRDIGSTIDQNSRNGPAPSTVAASNTSRGRLSKNRLHQHDVERARAGGQPTPSRVDAGDGAASGTSRTVRYSGTSSTTAGTNRVASTSRVSTRRVPRAQHRQHVARRWSRRDLHDPRARGDHDGVEEVLARSRRRSRPSRGSPSRVPFGHSAIGCAQGVLGRRDRGLGQPQHAARARRRPARPAAPRGWHRRSRARGRRPSTGRRSRVVTSAVGAERRGAAVRRRRWSTRASGVGGTDRVLDGVLTTCSTTGSAGSRRPTARRGTAASIRLSAVAAP